MATIKPEDRPHYTYDDYKLWDGKWEIIAGMPYAMSPAPSILHQNVSNNIAWQLKEIFQDCSQCQSLLPVDWKIAEDTVVQPDNLVICDTPNNKAYLTKAPVIIFEILSKSTARMDENLKYNLYETEGVKYYVIVNADDKVAKVHELNNGKYSKVGDFYDEIVEFAIDQCDKPVKFDFAKVW